ncbi:hypothetical protein K445DRAFT_369016 [Daldinia sp. EC12]|nr:hypothetical protein K445DRAFT_369016 [Daldinia sp. EC12]
MAQSSSSSITSAPASISSESNKAKSGILSPITKGYLGEIGRVIFDDASRNVAKADIALYYEKKAALEQQGLQGEAEWDGTPIDYAMYYYHRFFHDEGCICPHEIGPGFNGPGKWARGAYNCYNPKEFVPAPPAASGSSAQPNQADGKVGESSAAASKSHLELERRRWEKIQAYWNHEFIKSPFIPSTFEEYIKFKNDSVKARQLAVLKKADAFNSSTGQGHNVARPQVSRKLLEIHNTDNLSLVNTRVSIWHQNPDLFIPIDWPLRWEYEYYQGQLPLPRVQEVDRHFKDMVTQYKLFPAHGPKVPRQFRRIANRALNPLVDGMTVPEYDDILKERNMEIAELEMDELNGFTQQLLQDIDEPEI